MAITDDSDCSMNTQCTWYFHSSSTGSQDEYKCVGIQSSDMQYCDAIIVKDDCYESGPNGEQCDWTFVAPATQPNDGVCQWDNAGSSTAGTIPTANPCVVMTDESSCSATAECSWFSKSNRPLFTESFCHPAMVNGNTT
jgi:hypothetical protein